MEVRAFAIVDLIAFCRAICRAIFRAIWRAFCQRRLPFAAFVGALLTIAVLAVPENGLAQTNLEGDFNASDLWDGEQLDGYLVSRPSPGSLFGGGLDSQTSQLVETAVETQDTSLIAIAIKRLTEQVKSVCSRFDEVSREYEEWNEYNETASHFSVLYINKKIEIFNSPGRSQPGGLSDDAFLKKFAAYKKLYEEWSEESSKSIDIVTELRPKVNRLREQKAAIEVALKKLDENSGQLVLAPKKPIPPGLPKDFERLVKELTDLIGESEKTFFVLSRQIRKQAVAIKNVPPEAQNFFQEFVSHTPPARITPPLTDIQEPVITTAGQPPEIGGATGGVINVLTKDNPFATPVIGLNIFYRFQNVANINFKTADFLSGAPNTIELGPDKIDGVGGSFDARIPSNYFLDTPDSGSHDLAFGYDTFSDIRFSINHLSGEDRTTFLQQPGTQQIVGGINGSGTPFGLNTRTTFDTEYDSLWVDGGLGVGIGGPVIKDRLWFFTSVNVDGGFRKTDIDINYSTGNAGGPTFNNFTTINSDEFITRATLGLGARFLIPGTNKSIEINADGKVGPSLHFGDFDFSDCGSTDGTGGVCNGGFFRTNLNTSSTDIGLYSEFNLGIAARLGKRLKLEANGGLVIQDLYEFDLNSNVATTPGAIAAVGGVSPHLETNVGFTVGARATISFSPTKR